MMSPWPLTRLLRPTRGVGRDRLDYSVVERECHRDRPVAGARARRRRARPGTAAGADQRRQRRVLCYEGGVAVGRRQTGKDRKDRRRRVPGDACVVDVLDEGEIAVDGGAGLAAAAIELGLVDELRMFRNPVVVGGGTPFLPPVTENVPLDLIETRTFGSRVIYERYGRARDERD